MIFAAHRELNLWRPAPSLDEKGKVRATAEHPMTSPRWSEPVDCNGRMVIDDDTKLDDIWEATCDRCGFQIGIPPRARRAFEDAGGLG